MAPDKIEFSFSSKEIMNVFSNISENVTIQDKDLRLLYANKAAASSVNNKKEDILGHYCYKIWEEKKTICPSCPVKKAFQTGKYQEGENTTPDGKSWHIKAFPIRENKEVKAVMEITTDITIKKRAENAIIESEKKYRFIAENSSDIIFIQDLDLNYLFVSPSVKGLLGYEVDEIMQMDMQGTMTKESYEKAVSKYKEYFELAQKGEFPDIPLMQFEYIKKSGEKLWGEIKVGFLRNSNGKLVGSQGIIRDITQRVKRQEELKRAKEKAEESDRLKSAFLANMTHEIRTPLNAILGFAELMKDDDIELSQKDKFADIIYEKGNDLLQILNDIIDISRIEAQQLSLNPTYFSNNTLLQELHEFFLPYLYRKNKDVDFLVQLPLEEKDSLMFGDRIKIQQVLSNLVSNAIKFTSRGKIEMGYRIKNDKGEKDIQYFVSDTGIGIDPRHHYMIFDRFQQIAGYSTREHSGTGLGLAISRSLVEMMGGKIWIDSRLNHGATFYFTIPNRNADKFSQPKAKKINSLPDWKNKRVLLVEDDKFAYMLLYKMLEKTGPGLVYADSGYKAIEIFNMDQDFDLVILDIQMPGMDGYQVLEQIKMIAPELPIIAQTAYAMDNHKSMAEEQGFTEYLSKPVSKKVLLETLKKYLG